MFGQRIILGNKSKDEAEKPFWISFADLMSALMVLFLLVMSVALLAVTKPKPVSDAENKAIQRETEITQLLNKIEAATKEFPGVSLNKERKVINFGNHASFKNREFSLDSSTVIDIRNIVSTVVLKYADDELGKKWFKRITVAGFTSKTGSYLYNLNLSLNRSQSVLCALLTDKPNISNTLSKKELEQVRDLFFIGGYSFNDIKETEEESRRIELALEFYGVNDEQPPPLSSIQIGNFGDCQITYLKR
jgi:outer membrane protein OmpA-like peptidoglycan-associated protein